jgi:hypothetical protein
MSNGGPYKPGRMSKNQIEQVYKNQVMHINMPGNYLKSYEPPPDVYIAGRHYSGQTGQQVK